MSRDLKSAASSGLEGDATLCAAMDRVRRCVEGAHGWGGRGEDIRLIFRAFEAMRGERQERRERLSAVWRAPSTPPQVEREGSRDDLEALDLDALEKVARAADIQNPRNTHARPWVQHGHGVSRANPSNEHIAIAKTSAAAAHIATFDPPTVLRLIATNRELGAKAAAPIAMILFCPSCGLQHIDQAVDEEDEEGRQDGWSNPPHRSHLCHGCGHIWRPADVATEGVAYLDGYGENDSPPIRERAGSARAEAAEASNRELARVLQAFLDAPIPPPDSVFRDAEAAISNALSKSEGSRDEEQ